MSEKRRIAYFLLSPELLKQSLKMPPLTEIVNIFREVDLNIDGYRVYIQHPDLPEVQVGSVIPEVDPIISEIRWDWGVGENSQIVQKTVKKDLINDLIRGIDHVISGGTFPYKELKRRFELLKKEFEDG